MRNYRYGVSRQSGFTLLEILASFAVISMMVVVVYGILHVTRKSQSSHEKKLLKYSLIRRGLEKLESDLSMAYLSLGEDTMLPERRTYFTASPDVGGTALSFSTFSHVRRGRKAKEGNSCIVQYNFIDDPNDPGRYILRRKETHRLENRTLDEMAGESWGLIPGIISMNMEFFDAQNDEWVEEWDTVAIDGKINKLPNIVKIHLVVDNGTNFVVHFHSRVTPRILDAINLMPSASSTGNYMNIKNSKTTPSSSSNLNKRSVIK
jgi:prepilin-type N-terminal cleavage/methylation domain-containing protein